MEHGDTATLTLGGKECTRQSGVIGHGGGKGCADAPAHRLSKAIEWFVSACLKPRGAATLRILGALQHDVNAIAPVKCPNRKSSRPNFGRSRGMAWCLVLAPQWRQDGTARQ